MNIEECEDADRGVQRALAEYRTRQMPRNECSGMETV
jgi:hypothetical protein